MSVPVYYWNPEKKLLKDIAGIREEYPNASIPEGADLSFINYFSVEETPVPEYNANTEYASFSIASEQDKGELKYIRKWVVTTLPEDTVQENIAKRKEYLKENFVANAQILLDRFAQERGYDDIRSAVSYSSSSVPAFKKDALICIAKRDAMWSALFDVLEKVQGGNIPLPSTFSDIQQYLPALTWE